MPIQLEDVAKRAIKSPVALLLGAGAAIPSGAPSANDLATLLINKLDKSVSQKGRSLARVAEILCIKNGRRGVIEALSDILRPLNPTNGILLLPRFKWRGIYSTNYDTLVEKSFNNAQEPLTVIRSDLEFDKVEDAEGAILFKMHGCITQDQALGHATSLILTETDYHAPRQYRDIIFQRFSTDIAASGVIVIGHSLSDIHLSDILRDLAELQKASGYRNRITVIVYEQDDDYALIMEEIGINVAYGDVNTFTAVLLDLIGAEADAPKVAPIKGVQLPKEILSVTNFVIPGEDGSANAEAIYNGRSARLSDIEAGLTFRRDMEDMILHRLQSGARVIPIIGVAGTGKTTLARRILLECSRNDILCWEHSPYVPPRANLWVGVDSRLREAGRTGILFLDDVTRHQRHANDLVRLLSKSGVPGLHVLTTSETSQWNPRQKDKAFFEHGSPIELSKLSDAELRALLDLAASNEYLGRLVTRNFAEMIPARQVAYLKARSEKDMFLALRAMFENETLDQIILNEYTRLTEAAQNLYRDVCGLQSAGMTVHRQLLLRMRNVSANAVVDLLSELHGLVFELPIDTSSGIFVWEARHPRIAEIISSYKFSDPLAFIELISDAVDQVNPTVGVERQFIADLCNRDQGIKSIKNPHERIRLYSDLITKDPRARVPRHRLIREFLESGDFDAVDTQIREAENTIRLDPPIQRYKVMTLLRRAEFAGGHQQVDARALLQRAKSESEEGIRRFPESKYQYFALEKVATAWFRLSNDRAWLTDARDRLRTAYDRLLDPDLESAAVRIEQLLR